MINLTTTATRPGAGPFSVECPNLLQHHLDHLKASAISIDVIKERGYKSVLGKTPLKEAGFSKVQQRAPGILIPLYSVDGGAIARLKRTGNPKSLQIHLGHSDVKMTMRYLATMQVVESLETESRVNFDR